MFDSFAFILTSILLAHVVAHKLDSSSLNTEAQIYSVERDKGIVLQVTKLMLGYILVLAAII